jgi:CubicO group peptidase (beta-lactamase class C family)
MPFSTGTTDRLRQTVDKSCSHAKNGIPGVTVVVVDKNGDELFAHSAGKRGCNSEEQMTAESVFWIASCTKMIVGIACMQLVETGALKLDDSDALESLCPELKDVKVLQDSKLVPKKRGITLRMLLTHTGTSIYLAHEFTLIANSWVRLHLF